MSDFLPEVRKTSSSTGEGLSNKLELELEKWIFEEGMRLGSTIASLILEIDLVLLECQRILDKAQPSVEGKIDIRWWASRSGEGSEPYVFEWKQIRSGKWTAVRLGDTGLARFAKRGGLFKPGYRLVSATLSEVDKLLSRRRDLLGTYGKFRQVVGNKINGAKMLLASCGAKLESVSVDADEVAAHRPASTRNQQNS